MRQLNLVKLCLSMQIFLYFNSLVEKLCLSLASVEPSTHLAYIPDGSHSLTVRNISNAHLYSMKDSVKQRVLIHLFGGVYKGLNFSLSLFQIFHKLKMSHISLQKLTIKTYLWTLTIVTELFLKSKKICKIFNLIKLFK